ALVVCAPHTRDTRHLVDQSVFRTLRRGGYLINVSRGAVVDETALLRNLRSGHVAACALDVFGTEPLPRSNPLWSHPRVLVSPHVSAVTERFWERESELIIDNIKRYRSGRKLRNLVDQDAGY